MSKNYLYPRVDVSTKALRHSSVQPIEDTTVLFVPLMAEKGPVGELTPIHSLGEFIEVFGNLSFEKQGRAALNIENWLSNGGTVYFYRLDTIKETISNETVTKKVPTAEFKNGDNVIITAKYPGEYYKDLKITVRKVGTTKYNFIIKDKSNATVDNFSKKSEDFDSIPLVSDYIASVNFSNLDAILLNVTDSIDLIGSTSSGDTISFTGENNKKLVDYFINSSLSNVLGNELLAPIDDILDPGYSAATTNDIDKFLKENRNDIFFSITEYEEDIANGNYSAKFKSEGKDVANTSIYNINDPTNSEANTVQAVYEHKINIIENTITENSKEIEVSPIYFLSSLLPYNDINYGVQFPTAGTRRGVLNGIRKLDKHLTPSEKNEWFENRINYIEKDTRGYYLMTQRTFDGSTEDNYSALSFINNRRALNRIIKDIKLLGRDYLYEFNDSITISQLQATINKYLSGWIANRTFAKAVAKVEPDEYSAEKVNITIDVKFNGSVEVISVDITIE